MKAPTLKMRRVKSRCSSSHCYGKYDRELEYVSPEIREPREVFRAEGKFQPQKVVDA